MKIRRIGRGRGFWPGLLWLAGVISLQAVPCPCYVVQKNGIKMEGKAIVMNPDKSVVLTTPDGGVITFAKEQYTEARAERPEALAAAQKMIADGKYEEAIRMLTPIAREYTGLDWDIVAQLQIARALVGKKDFTGAIARYEDLFTKMPEVKKQSDALWSYHGALQEAKQYDKLKAALKQALAEGSHADVLRAQMMRGDLEAEQGNLENALLDYLRTVTFAKTGKEAPPKEVVPQAMLKTAQTLEKMKDGRAKEWYRKVVQDYPQSPEAAVAKKKI